VLGAAALQPWNLTTKENSLVAVFPPHSIEGRRSPQTIERRRDLVRCSPVADTRPAAGAIARSQRGLDWFIFFSPTCRPVSAVRCRLSDDAKMDAGRDRFCPLGRRMIGLLGRCRRRDRRCGGSERLMAGWRLRPSAPVSRLCVVAIFPVVTAAAILHALASCVLGPRLPRSASACRTLAIGERLGRNARFASLATVRRRR